MALSLHPSNWIPRPIKEALSSLVDLPMDSESTARVVDAVDLGKFQADKTFTPTNGAALAALATMAYSSPEDQRKHLALQPGVRSFQFLDSENNAKMGINAPDTGTQISLVETDGALLVAARGTTPPWLDKNGAPNDLQWQDYKQDIDAAPVLNYDGDARVHEGFKVAADGIWDQLKPLLQSAMAAHKAIHLTGHSLGAAIALQLGDRMHEELGVLPQSVVRTGGPDIGWKDEKAHLDKIGLSARTVNFVNNTDPIPLILPKGVSAGNQLYFDRHGKADLQGGHHTLDRVLGTANGILHANVNPLYDHVPVFYNELLADPKNAEALQKFAETVTG